MITSVDLNGRITIPAKIRKQLGIRKGAKFAFEIEEIEDSERKVIRLVPVEVQIVKK